MVTYSKGKKLTSRQAAVRKAVRNQTRIQNKKANNLITGNRKAVKTAINNLKGIPSKKVSKPSVKSTIPVVSQSKDALSFAKPYQSFKPNYNQGGLPIKTGNILSTLLGLAFPAYGAVKTGSWLANKLINNDTTNNLYDNISFNSLNKTTTEPKYTPSYQDNIYNSLNLNTNNSPYYTGRANRPGMFENIVGKNQTTNIVSRPGLYETITDGYQPYLRPNNPANFQDTINANIGLNMGQIYKDIRQPIGNPALSDYSTIFTDSTFQTPTYNTLSLNPNRWADMLNTSRGF